ncbi:MAG: ATP-binding cassette domain-containing protein, partial [Candidatus Lambdaproteobacteria bacterium]|nr:ATP-binding cassette domain-containing protein [Candidatus Lambdaproteobacteria bacterium]
MIDFQNLTKSYMGMSPVLDNVQFHIGKGEFFYLTGVSGAGKTTVFKLLLAMEQPDAGEVLFDGAPLGRPNPRLRALHRRRIGMVFQDYRLLNRESVEDNVALPMRVAGLRGGVIRRRVTALLEQVGLQERRRESAMVLSGGEKQLVSIARALTLEPPVVLADEP